MTEVMTDEDMFTAMCAWLSLTDNFKVVSFPQVSRGQAVEVLHKDTGSKFVLSVVRKGEPVSTVEVNEAARVLIRDGADQELVGTLLRALEYGEYESRNG